MAEGLSSLVLPIDAPRAEGGHDVLTELFRRHEVRLGRFLAQVVSDPWLADDLLQETFVVALREREQLPSIENHAAWLFAIARNRALAAMRRRRIARRALARLVRDKAEEVAPDASEAVAARDYLVRHVRSEDRVLLVLRYVHGFTSAELAEMTGRSAAAIRQQLSRATRELARTLNSSSPPNASTGGRRH